MTKLLQRGFYNKNHIYFLLIISFLFLSGSSSAQDGKKIFHPLSGSVLLSLEYSTTVSQTDYNSSTFSFAWRGSGEYFLPINSNLFSGIRAYGGSGYLAGKRLELSNENLPPEFKTSILYGGIGVELGYRINEKLYPYIMPGINYIYIDHIDVPSGNRITPNSKTHSAVPSIELGARYFVNDNIALNASLSENFYSNDDLDNLTKGMSKDAYLLFNVGVSYAFLIKKDSDNDGIEDKVDQCRETPPGVLVDDFGCPLDSDNDGVPDYLDKCPITYKGVQVDPEGCPVDTDKDNVPDYLDKCPNTPAGIRVNSMGCPLDSDEDGVPDYLDKCPGTPAGTQVDSKGCAVQVEPVKPVDTKPKFDSYNQTMIQKDIWTDGKLYVIQVSAWKEENKAEAVVESLKNRGYDAFVETMYIPKLKGTFYRARIGYFNTLQEALAVYNRLNIK